MKNIRNALLDLKKDIDDAQDEALRKRAEYFSCFPKAHRFCLHSFVRVGDEDMCGGYRNMRVCVNCGHVSGYSNADYHHTIDPSHFYNSKRWRDYIDDTH